MRIFLHLLLILAVEIIDGELSAMPILFLRQHEPNRQGVVIIKDQRFNRG